MTYFGKTTTGLRCPQCDSLVDGYCDPKAERRPEPDDITICVHCSTINVFTDNEGQLGLRKPTSDELTEYLNSSEVQRTLVIVAAARERGIIPPPGRTT